MATILCGVTAIMLNLRQENLRIQGGTKVEKFDLSAVKVQTMYCLEAAGNTDHEQIDRYLQI